MSENRLEKLMRWYSRRLAPIAFIGGFLLDTLTLTRADLPWDNIWLITHLVIAGFGIALVNGLEEGTIKWKHAIDYAWLPPFMIQFSFGALFSGFTVLYTRSGSFTASWLFIALLALLLIGNEFFRERYRRLAFHLGLYFVALFSYSAFALPILVNRIGPAIFLLSGLAALLIITMLGVALMPLARTRIRTEYRRVAISIGVIYLVFNALYFSNLIPPIPLVLKELAVCETISRQGNDYRAVCITPSTLDSILGRRIAYTWRPGTPLLVFSAVFAPSDLHTTIYHRWLFRNEETRDWEERGTITFPINGGRDGGYRGYSRKNDIEAGRWRVEIRTEQGQLLGRQTFNVIETSGPSAGQEHTF